MKKIRTTYLILILGVFIISCEKAPEPTISNNPANHSTVKANETATSYPVNLGTTQEAFETGVQNLSTNEYLYAQVSGNTTTYFVNTSGSLPFVQADDNFACDIWEINPSCLLQALGWLNNHPCAKFCLDGDILIGMDDSEGAYAPGC